VPYRQRLHIVLHEPEIPYNAGNIGRTCVAVGAKLWMVRPLGFSVDDYYVRRAGLDYWKLLEWEVCDDWPSLVQRLDGARMWFFSKTGARSYADAQYREGDALVYGSESKGLPSELLQANAGHVLRMPMRPEVRSLNLSNAAAIAAYEALRQGAFSLDD
jgi:tRNA (cytidine/uridine-2'-O-)-methyltransferase